MSVSSGVAGPAHQTTGRDFGIHAFASGCPHLRMPIGERDFDVADVRSIVTPLSGNIDYRHARWNRRRFAEYESRDEQNKTEQKQTRASHRLKLGAGTHYNEKSRPISSFIPMAISSELIAGTATPRFCNASITASVGIFPTSAS